jgi:hypothetical protein
MRRHPPQHQPQQAGGLVYGLEGVAIGLRDWLARQPEENDKRKPH